MDGMNKHIEELRRYIKENPEQVAKDLQEMRKNSTGNTLENYLNPGRDQAILFAEYLLSDYDISYQGEEIKWRLSGTNQLYTSEEVYQEFIK